MGASLLLLSPLLDRLRSLFRGFQDSTIPRLIKKEQNLLAWKGTNEDLPFIFHFPISIIVESHAPFRLPSFHLPQMAALLLGEGERRGDRPRKREGFAKFESSRVFFVGECHSGRKSRMEENESCSSRPARPSPPPRVIGFNHERSRRRRRRRLFLPFYSAAATVPTHDHKRDAPEKKGTKSNFFLPAPL